MNNIKCITEVTIELASKKEIFNWLSIQFLTSNSQNIKVENWREYEQKTEIGEYFKYIFGLPFLDPQSVDDCFLFELAEIQPNNEKVLKCIDYFVKNSSLFSPQIWTEKSSSVCVQLIHVNHNALFLDF